MVCEAVKVGGQGEEEEDGEDGGEEVDLQGGITVCGKLVDAGGYQQGHLAEEDKWNRGQEEVFQHPER